MNKKIKKVAIYPGYDNMLKDAIFDTNSLAWKQLRGLPIFERYVALKKFLNQKEIELHTYDIYKSFKEIDLWIMLEVTPKNYFFLFLNFINPKKVIPVLLEPSIVNTFQWKYISIWSFLHKNILTWSPELVKRSSKFIRFHYIPFAFNKTRCQELRMKSKKDLCLLIQSNKASKIKGELYSLRRKIIRYFEGRGDNFLDLFGYGWNSQNTRHLGPSEPFYTTLYRGEAGDKWETFSQYKFIFCIQNAIPAGQFEGDAFMAMAVGSVPIYLPPPDVDEFIPQDTYINFSQFENLDELTLYLKKIINSEEYEKYRRAGWEYINSAEFRPFTVEQFSEDVYNAILLQETK